MTKLGKALLFLDGEFMGKVEDVKFEPHPRQRELHDLILDPNSDLFDELKESILHRQRTYALSGREYKVHYVNQKAYDWLENELKKQIYLNSGKLFEMDERLHGGILIAGVKIKVHGWCHSDAS